MNHLFTSTQWDVIRENYTRWWAGELKRPLIHMTLEGYPAPRPEPTTPNYWFTSSYELSVPESAIVDRWDYNLSRCKFLGDGFPGIWCNFGPGVIAAFLGADLIPIRGDAETAWFHPQEIVEISELSFTFRTDSPWYKRVVDLSRTAMEKWQGKVQLSMTDLGGNLDILSSFRPSEGLLFDVMDHPEQVKRVTFEAHDMWWRYFEELNKVLQPTNPGYTAWAPIFSTKPYYILQCDFAYMLGPDQFDEFVKPELVASCKRLTNAFYHLDGIGQLPHLDSLLAIPELKGVQWVPGDGQPPITEWPEVHRKIRDAGKLIQIWGKQKELDALAEQLGSAEGILLISDSRYKVSEEREGVDLLKKYKAL